MIEDGNERILNGKSFCLSTSSFYHPTSSFQALTSNLKTSMKNLNLFGTEEKSSRRSFLRNAGAMALAAPALSWLSEPAFGRNPMQGGKPLGVALVGLGYYSTHQLAPALEKTKFCKLTGVVTGTPAKA